MRRLLVCDQRFTFHHIFLSITAIIPLKTAVYKLEQFPAAMMGFGQLGPSFRASFKAILNYLTRTGRAATESEVRPKLNANVKGYFGVTGDEEAMPCGLRLGQHLELISSVPTCRRQSNKSLQVLFTSNCKASLDGEIEQRPLCLIFGWFAAERKHLMKFASLYLDQDFDVLLVTTKANHLITPVASIKCTRRQTLDFLGRNRHTYGPIVVHGFSIGAAIWGQLLLELDKNPAEYGFLREKVRGQVWDSPFVDVERLPKISSLTTSGKDPQLQRIVENLVTFQINLFNGSGRRFFERSFQAFRTKNLKASYLSFTSEDDEASSVSTVASCAEAWRRNGSTVYWKMWKSSRHVCHIRYHPEEYKALLRLFLEELHMLKYPKKLEFSHQHAAVSTPMVTAR